MGDNDAQTKATCPECGASIEASSTVCSECGFPLKSPKPEAPAVSKWLKLPKMQLGVVLCVEGYEDAKREAESAGWLLKSGYERIADTYEDMMDDDLKKIWQYRIGAIVSCSVGAILVFSGIKNMRDSKEGSDGTV